MTTGRTDNLKLALPVQGELSGTWGDTVNNGITDYVDIAVAGTLTLTGDGAVNLSLTEGAAAGTNIGSTTAQYAIIKVTGTLTTTKVITAPASSKTYVVINAATGGSVTVKASGQTGVTVAVGEKAYVAFSDTDYVKIAGSDVDGVSTISFGTTGLTPSTATSGAVTVSGTLAVANGGTNISSYTTGDIIYASGSATLSKLGIGTANYVLTSSGSAPQWTQYLSVAQGGTGASSLTANNVILGNGTSAVQVVAPGTSGNVLTSDGTTWSSQAPAASGITAGKSIAFDLIFAI
jgi:hypothetical protein